MTVQTGETIPGGESVSTVRKLRSVKACCNEIPRAAQSSVDRGVEKVIRFRDRMEAGRSYEARWFD